MVLRWDSRDCPPIGICPHHSRLDAPDPSASSSSSWWWGDTRARCPSRQDPLSGDVNLEGNLGTGVLSHLDVQIHVCHGHTDECTSVSHCLDVKQVVPWRSRSLSWRSSLSVSSSVLILHDLWWQKDTLMFPKVSGLTFAAPFLLNLSCPPSSPFPRPLPTSASPSCPWPLLVHRAQPLTGWLPHPERKPQSAPASTGWVGEEAVYGLYP